VGFFASRRRNRRWARDWSADVCSSVLGVGPVAGGIEREGAVAVAAGGAGLGGEIGLALVGVGDGERAAGCDVAGDDAEVFGHAAGGDAADHGGVVGADRESGRLNASDAAGADGVEGVEDKLTGA